MSNVSESARAFIGSRLAALDDETFKQIFSALFRELGWEVSWSAEHFEDGDLRFFADHIPYAMSRPGMVGRVKRRPGPGSAAEIEEARATIADWDDDAVAFIALDGFTDDARAKRQESGRRILLTDADELIDMWAEHRERIDPAVRRLLEPEDE